MIAIAELYTLQELDLALDTARVSLEDVQSRLGDSEEVAEAVRAVAERQEVLRLAEKEFKEREWEADEMGRQIEPVEQRLYQGNVRNPKELEDLQRDVDSLKRRRNELEDRALEAMEALEQAQQELDSAQRELQDLTDSVGAEQVELSTRKAALEAEIAELQQRRDAQVILVDPVLLQLYDRLSAIRERRPVAKVQGGACQGCRISLPMNLVQRARSSGDLVQCSSCERILYVT